MKWVPQSDLKTERLTLLFIVAFFYRFNEEKCPAD